MLRPNRYEVFVSPESDRKLAAHIEFLSRVSESAAKRLYQEYGEALDFLANAPQACPSYVPARPIEADLRSRTFAKRYRIVFEIIGFEVYIYDIQDCRQDVDKSLVD